MSEISENVQSERLVLSLKAYQTRSLYPAAGILSYLVATGKFGFNTGTLLWILGIVVMCMALLALTSPKELVLDASRFRRVWFLPIRRELVPLETIDYFYAKDGDENAKVRYVLRPQYRSLGKGGWVNAWYSRRVSDEPLATRELARLLNERLSAARA